MRDFWEPRFYSNTYSLLDTPLPGVADYLQRLQAAGAYIVYLTGRDRPRMEDGTRAVLRLHGFPVPDNQGARLLMKESVPDVSGLDEKAAIAAKVQSDVDFKRRAREEIRSLGRVVASFDDGAKNAEANYRNFHNPADGGIGNAILIYTTPERVGAPHPEVKVLNGFLLE